MPCESWFWADWLSAYVWMLRILVSDMAVRSIWDALTEPCVVQVYYADVVCYGSAADSAKGSPESKNEDNWEKENHEEYRWFTDGFLEFLFTKALIRCSFN